jgi:hypothetical protein
MTSHTEFLPTHEHQDITKRYGFMVFAFLVIYLNPIILQLEYITILLFYNIFFIKKTTALGR